VSAHDGGCRCGAVRYAAAGEPERHAVCHCEDCRRSAGAPMVAWMLYPREAVEVTGATSVHRSSEDAERHFCPQCGTGLFYRHAAWLPGKIDIQSATLDDPDGVAPPTKQVQTAERLAWMGGLHAIPEFARFKGE
jgi:hypothetical protein